MACALALVGCGQQEAPEVAAPSPSEETSESTQIINDSSIEEAGESDALPEEAATFPLTITDPMGHELTFTEPPDHVVSLMSSFTETWLLAGGRDQLVLTTEDAQKRGFDVGNAELSGTVEHPSTEAILAKEPDFVIVSADLAVHQEVATLLEDNGIPVYHAQIENLDDYLKVLQDFTMLTGRADLYEENGVEVEKRVDELLTRYPKDEPQPSYLFLRGSSTALKVQAKDTVLTDIMDQIGAKNVAGDGALAGAMSPESILAADPDYLFIIYQGKQDAFEKNFEENFTSHPVWQEIRAVKEDRVYVLDRDLFHYKPNARWDETYETLFSILRPDLFEQE